jgi:hypothetical protein
MNKASSTAILCSVKGMNPMTGQRVSGFDLMNFQEKCPIHNEDFKHGLFCPKCNFKWPDQNYYSFPNQLFCDGFRLPDGTERQFYFTEDMAKSIPEQVIGKDDTMPAFGFCFYETKERQKYEEGIFLKNKFPKNEFMFRSGPCGSIGFSGTSGSFIKGHKKKGELTFGLGESGLSKIYLTTNSARFDSLSKSSYTCKGFELHEKELTEHPHIFNSSIELCSSHSEQLEMSAMNVSNEEPASVNFVNEDSSLRFRDASAEVGIGAGNKIEKNIQKSSRALDEWKEKPSSIIRIYFVFREQFERYAESGFNDLEGVKEGFLEGVNV